MDCLKQPVSCETFSPPFKGQIRWCASFPFLLWMVQLTNLIAAVASTELSGEIRCETLPPLCFPWCFVLHWCAAEQRWRKNNVHFTYQREREGGQAGSKGEPPFVMCVCVFHLSPTTLGPDVQTCVCLWIIYSFEEHQCSLSSFSTHSSD